MGAEAVLPCLRNCSRRRLYALQGEHAVVQTVVAILPCMNRIRIGKVTLLLSLHDVHFAMYGCDQESIWVTIDLALTSALQIFLRQWAYSTLSNCPAIARDDMPAVLIQTWSINGTCGTMHTLSGIPIKWTVAVVVDA